MPNIPVSAAGGAMPASRRALLMAAPAAALLPAAALALPAPEMAGPHPDAELIALSERIQKLKNMCEVMRPGRSYEQRCWRYRAYEHVSWRIIQEMKDTRPHTLEGLLAKAQHVEYMPFWMKKDLEAMIARRHSGMNT